MSRAVSALSDVDLRAELASLGVNVGPVTGTTRVFYEKLLEKRRTEVGSGKGAERDSVGFKPRTASRSPGRPPKKSAVVNEEVVVEVKKAPEKRRSSSGGRMRASRSEREDDVDMQSAFINDEEAIQEPTIRSPVIPPRPQLSPVKKSPLLPSSPPRNPPGTVFPGLQNTISSGGYTATSTSKVADRTPTPPRSSYSRQLVQERIGDFRTPLSTSGYGTTSLSGYGTTSPSGYGATSSLTSAYSTPTSGRFSDLTASFLGRSSERPQQIPTSTASSVVRRGVLVNEEQQEEEDYEDDDDHTESSRIIVRGYTARRPSPPTAPPSASAFNAVCRLPGRIVNSIVSAFGSKPSYSTYDERRRLAAYRASLQSRGDRGGFGVDVSRLLLYSLSFLFAFLLVAYVATVHSQAFAGAWKTVDSAARDTALFFYTYAILPVAVLAVVIGIGSGVYFLKQRYVLAQAEEKRRVFDLIEKITDIIRDSSVDSQEYVAVPHVRDMLIPPSKRLRDSPEWNRWQEAVNFINQNESRVSTESRIINGVECAVWRWVPAKKSGWQGTAVEDQTQLNVPKCALSHCLKLRGLFPSNLATEAEGADVALAVKQKLAPIRPLHIHVERDSTEGVVFLRFASLADCKDGFTKLHGMWFNGQLVSAKYLRDERYDQRFPDALRR